jgi:hypothetical protein
VAFRQSDLDGSGGGAARRGGAARGGTGFWSARLAHQAVETSVTFFVVIALERHGVRLLMCAAPFARLTVPGIDARLIGRSGECLLTLNGRAFDPDAAGHSLGDVLVVLASVAAAAATSLQH